MKNTNKTSNIIVKVRKQKPCEIGLKGSIEEHIKIFANMYINLSLDTIWTGTPKN